VATWDAWFPDVLVHAPAAPDPLVRQALCRASRTFFRRTRAWMEWLDANATQAGTGREYDFEPPSQSELLRVERATVGGRPMEVQSYRDRSSDWATNPQGDRALVTRDLVTFVLTGDFGAGELVQVQASLIPKRNATGIPDHLADRYLEPIASGALSALLATPDVPFYKPDLAATYGLMFEQAINTATVDAYRGHTSQIPRASVKWF
jgi:hypothetical protein